MERAQLADFLRRRREAMQPEDVGLARTARRRTSGLRREEVAMVAGMSADYYTRLEQQRGPQPSVSMLAALARALRLSLPERDHLFRLAGHTPPSADVRSDHVSRGLARVLDRVDAPAMVTNDLGETLAQNPLAVALFGDERRFVWGAPERSRWYRWFADPEERRLHAPADHERLSRSYAAALRVATGRHPDDQRAQQLVDRLAEVSSEFAALWADHDVSWRPGDTPHLRARCQHWHRRCLCRLTARWDRTTSKPEGSHQVRRPRRYTADGHEHPPHHRGVEQDTHR